MKKPCIVFSMLFFCAGLCASCASKLDVRDGQTATSESEALVNPVDFNEVDDVD